MKINYLLWVGIILFSVLVLVIIFESSLVSKEKLEISRIAFYEDGSMDRAPFPPSKENIFGSDSDGKGIFDMMVLGTKDTLLIIFLITVIRYVIAIPLALFASEKRGLSHWTVTSLHTFFSSVPTLIAAIILVNMPFLIFSENRYIWCVLILAFIEVGRVSHLFQQQAYDLSEKEFIRVARLQGNSHTGIIFRHYLPYLFPTMITNFFTDLGRVTILIGQLGLFNIFVTHQLLDVGHGYFELQNSSYNWATLLSTTRTSLLSAPWIPLFPALALCYVMFTFNIIGEGLRRRFTKSAEYL